MQTSKSILMGIMLVAALIALFFFALPKYQESANLENNLSQQQAEYDSRLSSFENTLSSIKKAESRQEALQKINSALPDKAEFAPLVYFLQNKGAESGLAVKSVSFSQASPTIATRASSAISGKRLRDILFTVNASGNYVSLKNFLFTLEHSARLFEINVISFGSAEALQGSVEARDPSKSYDFNMEIKTHSY